MNAWHWKYIFASDAIQATVVDTESQSTILLLDENYRTDYRLADLIQMSGEGLTTKDTQEQVLQYHDVFSLEEREYGKVDIVKHHVNTEVHSPINKPLRRIPYTGLYHGLTELAILSFFQ